MNETRTWRVAGLIFLLAAVLMFVGDNVGIGCAFIALGVLFLAMPQLMASRGKKKP